MRWSLEVSERGYRNSLLRKKQALGSNVPEACHLKRWEEGMSFESSERGYRDSLCGKKQGIGANVPEALPILNVSLTHRLSVIY